MTYLAATTLTRVKSVLKITSTDEDVRLTELIRAVSFAFERYMDRELMAEARTEELDVRHSDSGRFFLGSGPITAVASVKNDAEWDWAGTSALSATSYHFDSSSASPLLLIRVALEEGPRALQVVYTGGLAPSTDGSGTGLVFTYPEIALAADIQVAEEWRRKNDPAAQSVMSVGAGTRSWIDPHKLLGRVQELLNPFRVLALL